MSEIQKIPFLRILLPLVFGIVIQYYILLPPIVSITMIFFGLFVILFSFFITNAQQYRYRWLFGFGVYLVMFSIGVFSTKNQQWKNAYPYSGANYVYDATIIDIPKEKSKTIQLKLSLHDLDRKIIAYLPIDSFSTKLTVGEKITFFSEIKPLLQMGSVGHFNYSQYLYNQGYCGIAFIPQDMWETNQNESISLSIFATKCKQRILNFYETLDLDSEELAILSGLTIGYKNDFSEDLLQSFRSTGTAHIFAVSGLHVGVVFFILSVVFQCIPHVRFRQSVILCLLWFYILMVGLPVSAMRAGLMLSLYSVGLMLYARTYVFNTISAAAFLILLFDPFSLFDLGFQFSFCAVLSISLLMPYLRSLSKTKSRISRFIYDTLVISLAAQIGILPLCLYYFGMFPVYFLFANFLIVPLLSILFYDTFLLFFTTLIGLLFKSIGSYITIIPVFIFKVFARWIIGVVRFFENMPYSTIENIEISLFTVFALFLLIFLIWLYLKIRSSKIMIGVLLCCLFIQSEILFNRFNHRNAFRIINSFEYTSVTYQKDYNVILLKKITKNEVLSLGDKVFYILNQNVWHNKKQISTKLNINYLLLETTDIISVEALTDVFRIEKIIFGNSISRQTVNRLTLECEKLRIPYYDLHSKGSLTINF